MGIEPKVTIKYKLEDGTNIVLNILDAKTKHLEQYVATLTQNKTLEALKELRNALRRANEEIDRLERENNELKDELYNA